MKELKSSSSRLVRLFKQSRENWKETALERQQKLRALEIKIRDLFLSRENWKKRAMKAEKELRIFRTNSADVKKKGEEVSEKIEELTAIGHHYSIEIIKLFNIDIVICLISS